MAELNDAQRDQILNYIFSNQKLAAIKLYLDITDKSLLESKQFIEELTEKLQQETPESFSTGNGCVTTSMCWIMLAMVLYLGVQSWP